MSQVENLVIHFVLSSESSTEDDASNEMKLTFDEVTKYGANAKWIKPSECQKSASTSKDVFVFEKFEGKSFEELKKQSAKILGCRCLMSCLLSGKSIPNSVTPVYTVGMRNIVVCCTGFNTQTKKKLQEKVEYMAGIFVKSMRAITTHVVAYNNISSKAIEAYKSKIPVMRAEWVNAVWERSIVSEVNGTDDEFKSFVSPLFHNMKITTSGMPKKEKEKIKQLVESNGGIFSGVLEEKSTTMLIISKPEGEKFKFAKTWNILCLKPGWLHNCVSQGIIIPTTDYVLDQKSSKASTPKKEEVNLTANFSMMSAIALDQDRMVTHLEETRCTLTFDGPRSQFQTPKSQSTSDGFSEIISEVLWKNFREAGQFLDGCNIYLTGFSGDDLEKLKKILNLAGGIRFDELTDLVSHVIVGKKTESLMASLAKVPAYVLSINWLVESMKLKKPAPENNFAITDKGFKNTEPPSPLSKLGAKLLTTIEHKTIEKPQFLLNKENDNLAQMEDELLNKYKLSQPGEPLAQRDNQLTRSTNSSVQSRPLSTQSSEEVFKGLSFFLSSELMEEERKQLEDIILEKGGNVVGKRHLGVPDYAVVPVCGAALSEMTTKEVVNIFFVKDCCFEDNVVALQYYHQPVACVRDAKPLKNCVVSVSNYIQCEREFIETLIDILGAVTQSLLARKPKNGILKSTHLVCSEPSGMKYTGALRWGLPVVHHDWLLKCAALGIRVSEQPYLIGESKLPAPSEASYLGSSKPPEAQTSQIRTPVAAKTPVVHNAISRLKQGESASGSTPDANRTLTPTSPYGAFYGNDNPSPGTRKRLWKWMNQGADFPLDPPMNYEEPTRRDSTPLSTVLSKLLVEMKRKKSPTNTGDYSPVSRKNPDSESEIPFKKLNLEEGKHDSIETGFKKMKEIEENYAKVCAKPLTPVRKQSDSTAPMLVMAESQPHTEVGWEDPNEKEIALENMEKTAEGGLEQKVFMLTRLTEEEENEVTELIEECGGKVSEKPHFDKDATHLISKDLRRDEKLMGSIASGLWVLHPSYVEQLKVVRDVNKVPEEHYEWGNPNQGHRVKELSATSQGIATSSYNWRIAIRNGEPRPFQGMKIILHLRMSKYDNFRRLIEAGGGEVISSKPPFRDVEATICVVENGYTEDIDLAELAKRKIPCVTILFLSDHMLQKSEAIEANLAQGFSKYWRKNNSAIQ